MQMFISMIEQLSFGGNMKIEARIIIDGKVSEGWCDLGVALGLY